MGEDVGRNMGMPLDQFSAAAYQGLAAGKDQVIVGSIGPESTFNDIVDKRRTAFGTLAEIMRSS